MSIWERIDRTRRSAHLWSKPEGFTSVERLYANLVLQGAYSSAILGGTPGIDPFVAILSYLAGSEDEMQMAYVRVKVKVPTANKCSIEPWPDGFIFVFINHSA